MTANGLGRRGIIGAAMLVSLGGAATDSQVWDFAFPSIDGGTLAFAPLRGRVLLVVNTASFCNYTYQYESLEKLDRDLAARGLTVIGVPSQDFGQESASNGEVKQFCELTYGVEFPMTEIAHVRGPAAMPFYAWVRNARDWEPNWNFNKVLISRTGQIKALFRSDVEPGSSALTSAIVRELDNPAA